MGDERLNESANPEIFQYPMIKHKVYVDSNGTTPIREEVCQLITKTLVSGWANPSSQSDDADVVSKCVLVYLCN